jgi:hypothetical protein
MQQLQEMVSLSVPHMHSHKLLSMHGHIIQACLLLQQQQQLLH